MGNRQAGGRSAPPSDRLPRKQHCLMIPPKYTGSNYLSLDSVGTGMRQPTTPPLQRQPAPLRALPNWLISPLPSDFHTHRITAVSQSALLLIYIYIYVQRDHYCCIPGIHTKLAFCLLFSTSALNGRTGSCFFVRSESYVRTLSSFTVSRFRSPLTVSLYRVLVSDQNMYWYIPTR